MERALMGSDYIREMEELAKIMRLTKEQEKEKEHKVVDPSWALPSKPISTIKTLIIHNIPRDIRVTDLRYLFEKYGPIRDIYIPRNMDRSSRLYDTIKGFALIKFFNAMDAQSAYDAEFGRLYIGFKLISIEFAKEDR
jgi:RNA recognition motif-containing protein